MNTNGHNPQRQAMPVDRSGITHKVEIGNPPQEGYIIANLDEKGHFKEMFLHGFGKEGSTLMGWTQVSALLFSIAMQYGCDLEVLANKLSQMKFEPNGATNNPEIPYVRSMPDYIVRWLALRFGTDELNARLKETAKTHA